MLEREEQTKNSYFTSEHYDSTFEFYYLRARYLIPAVGRFVTMDTFEGARSTPLSLHKYLYAYGDPVNAIDPSGNTTLKKVLITSGIIATLAGIAVEYYMHEIGFVFSRSGQCGPDVTVGLDETLKNIRETYDNDWTPEERRKACIKIYDWADKSRGGVSMAWDIEPLHYIGSYGIASNIRDWSDVKNGNGEGCEWTVAYDRKCYNAGYLNYVMWGAINQRCHAGGFLWLDPGRSNWSLSNALAFAAGWKTWEHRNIKSLPEVLRLWLQGINHQEVVLLVYHWAAR